MSPIITAEEARKSLVKFDHLSDNEAAQVVHDMEKLAKSLLDLYIDKKE